MLHYITPLTIAPAVSMIGLSLFHAASDMAEDNWPAYIGLVSCSEAVPNMEQELIRFLFQNHCCYGLIFPVPGDSTGALPEIRKEEGNDCGKVSTFPVVSCECSSYFVLHHPYCFHYPLILKVLLTIVCMWGLCALLTVTDLIPEEHSLRTDLRAKILNEAAWIRFPYPRKKERQHNSF